MTNYEHIKNMSIDEMESFLCGLLTNCVLVIMNGQTMESPNKQWLESEVDAK